MAMALAPDLLSGVMQAADPAGLQAARRRLQAPAAEGAFPGALRATALRPPPPPAAPLPAAGRQLEAFLLARSFENMLPDNSAGLFGDPVAGGMWRSLLADELGKSLSSAGAFGIAELLGPQDAGAPA